MRVPAGAWGFFDRGEGAWAVWLPAAPGTRAALAFLQLSVALGQSRNCRVPARARHFRTGPHSHIPREEPPGRLSRAPYTQRSQSKERGAALCPGQDVTGKAASSDPRHSFPPRP